jgi:predicted nucleic-acid-binding protein
VLRFLTGDDPVQTPIARDILDADFILPATVLLETEWVLRSWYKLPTEQVVAALRLLIDLPGAEELPPNVAWAVAMLAKGADFADAMHVATSVGATSFATFDGGVVRKAGRNAPLPIETLGKR